MPMRVREYYKSNPCALLDPKSGAHIVPDPSAQYADNDPLVLNAPWYFIAEGETEVTSVESVDIAEIEQATAAPGEKRTTRKPRGIK